MNDLKIFENAEFGQVRTVTIEDKSYFVGIDIAKSLGYSIPHKAVRDHCKGVLKQNVLTSGGEQDMLIITEGDVYRLIMKSKLPNALNFESWVMDEVLPSIRKTGTYQKPLTTQEIMREQLTMIDNVVDRVAALENNMTIDYSQQLTLEKLVNKQVTDALGGKDTNAYKEISKKVFKEIGRDIKSYFNVNSRNNIAVIDFDKARLFIQNWKPCYTTQLLINDCNAQMCMN